MEQEVERRAQAPVKARRVPRKDNGHDTGVGDARCRRGKSGASAKRAESRTEGGENQGGLVVASQAKVHEAGLTGETATGKTERSQATCGLRCR